MRIGVITLQGSNNNYGQLLQCWALQQVLLRLGHEVFLIQYNDRERPADVHIEKSLLQIFKDVAKSCLVLPSFYTRYKNREAYLWIQSSKKDVRRQFNKFRKEHILTSDIIYFGAAEIRNNPPVADIYITGSDQVWNSELVDNHLPYFLDFGQEVTKRYAYAASFGGRRFDEMEKTKLHLLLERFSGISVREREGIQLCEEFGVSAIQALDPTLLLDKNDYSEVCGTKKQKDNYIFIYSINVSQEGEIPVPIIKHYAKEKKQSIIITTSDGYLPGQELYNGVEYNYSTVQQWLSDIAYADLVVTTSFHGIVFSIIYHRNFLYVPLKGRFEKGNNRVLDLLNELGLSKFVLEDSSQMKDFPFESIIWEDIDEKLNFFRASSIAFLKEMC